MSDRIDKIFLSERLRQKWDNANDDKNLIEKEQTKALDNTYKNVKFVFENFKNLIHQQFSSEKCSVFDIMLNELYKTISESTGTEIPLEKINEMLNQIEDLIDAFEIGDSR